MQFRRSFFSLHIGNESFELLGKNVRAIGVFSIQPQVINRHFSVHGMLHRRILKRDAIQTILAVYNLYYLIEWMETIDGLKK